MIGNHTHHTVSIFRFILAHILRDNIAHHVSVDVGHSVVAHLMADCQLPQFEWKRLTQYMTRCPFRLSRLVKVSDTGQVVYLNVESDLFDARESANAVRGLLDEALARIQPDESARILARRA